MNDELKRLSRLQSILTQLQSKKLVTATSLAEKFAVSVRTIYRDIKALESSGVPILTEEGKGYSIMEGFRLPPVMFTEREAYALLTMEQLILKQKDASLIKECVSALSKIKAVMRDTAKEKTETLEKRIFVGKNWNRLTTSKNLIDLQFAITDYKLVSIWYEDAGGKATERMVEPFSIYHSDSEDWLLIAFCRARKDFRHFRIDRMKKMSILSETFPPHQLTLQQFAERYQRESY